MIKKISKAGMAIVLGISLLALNTNSVNAKVENGSDVEKVILKDNMKATATDVEVNSSENNIQKEIKKIQVNIEALTLNPGETKQLVVIGNMADGSTKDITSGSFGTTYESDSMSVAKVNGDGLIAVPSTAKVGHLARLTIKNNGKITYCDVTVGDPIPRAKSITVNLTEITLNPGEIKQLVVTGDMNDGTTKDISNGSNGTTYELDSPSIAKIDANGLIKITNDISKIGYVGRITVKNNGKVAYCTLTVGDPIAKIKNIALNPETITLKPGETKQLQVIATMSDGTTKDVTKGTNGTKYISGLEIGGMVDENGLLTIPSNAPECKVPITVKLNGLITRSIVIVEKDKPVEVKNVQIIPETITLKPGETKQLQVIATMSDGTTKDVTKGTNGTKYIVGVDIGASVDENGLLTIPSNAPECKMPITVKLNGLITRSMVIVEKDKPVEVKNVQIIPETITLKPGETKQLQVIATMSDGTTKDITKGDNGTKYIVGVEIGASIDENGLLTIPSNAPECKMPITAKLNGIIAKSLVTIEKNKPNMIKNLKLMPERTTLKVSESQQLKLIAIYEDGSEKDITEEATEWSLNNSEVIELNRETFYVKGLKKGVATIKVWVKGYGDFPAECQVTVVDNKEQNGVLNIEPEKDKIKLNEVVTANLVMDNIENIAAEDVVIKYDSEKLKFVDMKEVDGIKLVKNDIKAGELRFILASKGKNNIVNAKKTLLKLNFQGIKRGEALVDIVKGRVSDGIESEYSLEEKQCGQATIIIDDMADVNNSGEFTLLDLAIDARHLGEDPTALKQYNTDIEVNGAIDDADLLEIANQMLLNPNYRI